MRKSDIPNMAKRLRWAVWIFWACIVAAYVAGRFGLAFDSCRVQAKAYV